MAKAQWRATYEDTLIEQEKLREKLDMLIKEDRCIKDNDERDVLFPLISDACLGEDRDMKIDFFVKFPSGAWANIKNFSCFLSDFLYYTEDRVPHSYFERGGSLETVSVSQVWKAVRTVFFMIRPKAQHKAIMMSKEREDHSIGKGFHVGEKTKGTY